MLEFRNKSYFPTAPKGVSGPFNVQVINGYVIGATWERPTGRTGALTKYILRAIDRDDPEAKPVEAVFTNTTYERQGSRCGVYELIFGSEAFTCWETHLETYF